MPRVESIDACHVLDARATCYCAAMKLAKTVSLVAAGWLATISALHAWLNLDFTQRADAGPAFRVGFLPVT